MSSNVEPRWYVIRTLPNQEKLAEENLGRQGFGCFFPRILTTRRHARKFETVMVPLFPRYAFVALDVERQQWRKVNGTRGVESLVCSKERPLAVPMGVVESLIAAADGGGCVDMERGFRPGDTVRVTIGPFAGALGTLQRLDGRGRVDLLLSLMNSVVRASVAREALEPVT